MAIATRSSPATRSTSVGIVVGRRDGETLEAAYDRAYGQIGAILKRAGASWDDVVDITSFHTDVVAQMPAIAAAHKRHVKAPFRPGPRSTSTRSRTAASPKSRSSRSAQAAECAEGEGGPAHMWRNYLTVGFRALAKNKTYAFINIFGLGARPRRLPDDPALRPLRDELRRVAAQCGEHLPVPELTIAPSETGEEINLQMTSFVAGPALKKDFPQIETPVYAMSTAPVIMRGRPGARRPRTSCSSTAIFFDVLQIPARPGRSARRRSRSRTPSS